MPVDNPVGLWIKSGYQISAPVCCRQNVDNCTANTHISSPVNCRAVHALLLVTLILLTCSSIKPSWVVPGGTVSAIPGVLGNQSQKFCALTFDDGPDAKYTMQIMGILDSYGVKATFFVLGNQAQNRLDQVLALHNSGHEIANHSYSHPDFTKISTKQKRQELARLNGLLEPLGIRPKWFRPPYGAYNKTLLNIAASQGLETVLWTLDPKDWTRPGVDKIRRRVLSQTQSGEVVLLHSTNAQTVAALPGIIEGLRAAGFQFVTMSAWRKIVTGEQGVPSGQLPQPTPYPIAFAPGTVVAKNIFSQLSALGRLGLPQSIRGTNPTNHQPAPWLTVYANFQNQAGCYAIQQTGRSSGIYVYQFQAINPGNPGAQRNLYYHRANGRGADEHDTPEWPRPTRKPEV